MRILAIDTSCWAASAAVYDDVARQALAQETVGMAQGHAEALAPMVQRVMGQVEGGFSTIGRVAACIGPGSFTGIRIGLAMARAIALTIEAPMIGVSTFVAFAGPLLADPKPGVIVTAIDAKHGQVYFQLFEATGRPILVPMLASLREVVRAIGAGPARLAGNAAAMVAGEAERTGLVFDASEASLYPDIVSIARIGLAADPDAFPARPLYLKAPDAHPSSGDAIARTEG